MQKPPSQHVSPQYTDSVHTGNVVGQQIMQQNVHHHATQVQQVVQPCMGCGSRNYLKPVPCSVSDCKTICCNQCIRYHGWFKTAVCETHLRTFEFLNKVIVGCFVVLLGGCGLGIIVSGL
jgi:hypothetical protein